MFLCLDTSQGASVALIDGATTRARGNNDNPRQHTEALTPLITSMIEEAGATLVDLTAVVVGTGPAPFTGLRVGIITARTLAFTLGIPVYGVPSLAGLARTVFDVEEIDVVTAISDARRKEVYWATYSRNGEHGVIQTSPPAVILPADLAQVFDLPPLRGPGVELYPEVLSGHGATLDVATLGRIAHHQLEAANQSGEAPDLPTDPLYLRRPDIHMSAGRKRAS